MRKPSLTAERTLGPARMFSPGQPHAAAAAAQIPELNPVENCWQDLRENWLSNRVFASYCDILDHCCEAWNKLVDRPWLIMSIGLRDWVHRF